MFEGNQNQRAKSAAVWRFPKMGGPSPGVRSGGEAMKDADQAMNPLEDIAVVPEPSEKLLNQRQPFDYRTERENCLEWLLAFGKDPERAEGYAMGTVSNRASRMDQFYRWVWEQEDGYTSR